MTTEENKVDSVNWSESGQEEKKSEEENTATNSVEKPESEKKNQKKTQTKNKSLNFLDNPPKLDDVSSLEKDLDQLAKLSQKNFLKPNSANNTLARATELGLEVVKKYNYQFTEINSYQRNETAFKKLQSEYFQASASYETAVSKYEALFSQLQKENEALKAVLKENNLPVPTPQPKQKPVREQKAAAPNDKNKKTTDKLPAKKNAEKSTEKAATTDETSAVEKPTEQNGDKTEKPKGNKGGAQANKGAQGKKGQDSPKSTPSSEKSGTPETPAKNTPPQKGKGKANEAGGQPAKKEGGGQPAKKEAASPAAQDNQNGKGKNKQQGKQKQQGNKTNEN